VAAVAQTLLASAAQQWTIRRDQQRLPERQWAIDELKEQWSSSRKRLLRSRSSPHLLSLAGRMDLLLDEAVPLLVDEEPDGE
jgi:hypothetical protein